MLKSALVALALVTASAGGAWAGTRTLNVWGAHIDVPTYQSDDARAFVEPPRTETAGRGASRFMSLDGSNRNHHDRSPEHAR